MTSHTIPNYDVVYNVIYDVVYDVVYDFVFYNREEQPLSITVQMELV